jgi:hypothetical protein
VLGANIGRRRAALGTDVGVAVRPMAITPRAGVPWPGCEPSQKLSLFIDIGLLACVARFAYEGDLGARRESLRLSLRVYSDWVLARASSRRLEDC